jgi:hypothetical protein
MAFGLVLFNVRGDYTLLAAWIAAKLAASWHRFPVKNDEAGRQIRARHPDCAHSRHCLGWTRGYSRPSCSPRRWFRTAALKPLALQIAPQQKRRRPKPTPAAANYGLLGVLVVAGGAACSGGVPKWPLATIKSRAQSAADTTAQIKIDCLPAFKASSWVISMPMSPGWVCPEILAKENSRRQILYAPAEADVR